MPDTDPAVYAESVPEDALEIDQLDDVSGGGVGHIDGLHQEEASKQTHGIG